MQRKRCEEAFSRGLGSIESGDFWLVGNAMPEAKESMCSLIILFCVCLCDICPAKSLGKSRFLPRQRSDIDYRIWSQRVPTFEFGFRHLVEWYIRLFLSPFVDPFSHTFSEAFHCRPSKSLTQEWSMNGLHMASKGSRSTLLGVALLHAIPPQARSLVPPSPVHSCCWKA